MWLLIHAGIKVDKSMKERSKQTVHTQTQTLQQKLLNLVFIVFTSVYNSYKDELKLWAWYAFLNHTVIKE